MVLTIAIFIIILGILVFVHEFGHFIVAKKSGMQVDEFGFGFPPRMVGIQKADGKWRMVWGHKNPSQLSTTPSADAATPPLSDVNLMKEGNGPTLPLEQGEYRPQGGEGVDNTVYSINWIPLGGFVKIRGENNEHENDPRSFINRPFWGRLATLVAGVFMNFILAWVLLSAGLVSGLPVAVDSLSDLPAHATLKNSRVTIMEIQPGQPAAKAGVMEGDVLLAIDGKSFATTDLARDYILGHAGKIFNFQIKRGSQEFSFNISSIKNPGPNQGPTGIALINVGLMSFPWYTVPYQGLKATFYEISNIGGGLYDLITGHVSVKNLGGPVKIAQLTGQVSRMGFIYLLQFTAFLSINLAILNILPFPALDGGRVLFLIIEKIRGKRNNQKIEQWFNTIGFVLLLLLMALVTTHDIVNIFHK